MENARKEQSLEQEDAKPDENGRMGGCAKDRFPRQNPAKTAEQIACFPAL